MYASNVTQSNGQSGQGFSNGRKSYVTRSNGWLASTTAGILAGSTVQQRLVW